MSEDRPHVAIGGRMQVGKTTCAQRLVEGHGYELRPLAHPIKEIARSAFGWDGAKDPRGRRLLQAIGSVGRGYEPGLWLRRFEAWLTTRPGSVPVVVDDLRLRAEARRLRELGFLIVVVRRDAAPAFPEADLHDHETETELEGLQPDVLIVNDGTLDDLRRAVDRRIGRRRAR